MPTSRLNRPLVIGAIVVALILGVLIGGASGFADRLFGGPEPEDDRIVEPRFRCARRTGWCRSSRAMFRWSARAVSGLAAFQPSGR